MDKQQQLLQDIKKTYDTSKYKSDDEILNFIYNNPDRLKKVYPKFQSESNDQLKSRLDKFIFQKESTITKQQQVQQLQQKLLQRTQKPTLTIPPQVPIRQQKTYGVSGSFAEQRGAPQELRKYQPGRIPLAEIEEKKYEALKENIQRSPLSSLLLAGKEFEAPAFQAISQAFQSSTWGKEKRKERPSQDILNNILKQLLLQFAPKENIRKLALSYGERLRDIPAVEAIRGVTVRNKFETRKKEMTEKLPENVITSIIAEYLPTIGVAVSKGIAEKAIGKANFNQILKETTRVSGITKIAKKDIFGEFTKKVIGKSIHKNLSIKNQFKEGITRFNKKDINKLSDDILKAAQGISQRTLPPSTDITQAPIITPGKQVSELTKMVEKFQPAIEPKKVELPGRGKQPEMMIDLFGQKVTAEPVVTKGKPGQLTLAEQITKPKFDEQPQSTLKKLAELASKEKPPEQLEISSPAETIQKVVAEKKMVAEAIKQKQPEILTVGKDKYIKTKIKDDLFYTRNVGKKNEEWLTPEKIATAIGDDEKDLLLKPAKVSRETIPERLGEHPYRGSYWDSKVNQQDLINAENTLLQKSGLNNEEQIEYIQSTIADGEKLNTITKNMLTGKTTAEQAIKQIQVDFKRLKQPTKTQQKTVSGITDYEKELLPYLEGRIKEMEAGERFYIRDEEGTLTDIVGSKSTFESYMKNIGKKEGLKLIKYAQSGTPMTPKQTENFRQMVEGYKIEVQEQEYAGGEGQEQRQQRIETPQINKSYQTIRKSEALIDKLANELKTQQPKIQSVIGKAMEKIQIVIDNEKTKIEKEIKLKELDNKIQPEKTSFQNELDKVLKEKERLENIDTEDYIAIKGRNGDLLIQDKKDTQRHIQLLSQKIEELNKSYEYEKELLSGGEAYKGTGTFIGTGKESLLDPMLSNKEKEIEIYSRRFTESLAAQESLNNAIKNGEKFSLLMLDIDHFKGFNEQYGHDAGDIVLKKFSEILYKVTRNYGGRRVARHGGEEFLVYLGNKDIKQAAKIAEAIRESVQNNIITLPNDKKVSVTATIGAAESTADNKKDFWDLVKEADNRLLKGKHDLGRNIVVSKEITDSLKQEVKQKIKQEIKMGNIGNAEKIMRGDNSSLKMTAEDLLETKPEFKETRTQTLAEKKQIRDKHLEIIKELTKTTQGIEIIKSMELLLKPDTIPRMRIFNIITEGLRRGNYDFPILKEKIVQSGMDTEKYLNIYANDFSNQTTTEAKGMNILSQIRQGQKRIYYEAIADEKAEKLSSILTKTPENEAIIKEIKEKIIKGFSYDKIWKDVMSSKALKWATAEQLKLNLPRGKWELSLKDLEVKDVLAMQQKLNLPRSQWELSPKDLEVKDVLAMQQKLNLPRSQWELSPETLKQIKDKLYEQTELDILVKESIKKIPLWEKTIDFINKSLAYKGMMQITQLKTAIDNMISFGQLYTIGAMDSLLAGIYTKITGIKISSKIGLPYQTVSNKVAFSDFWSHFYALKLWTNKTRRKEFFDMINQLPEIKQRLTNSQWEVNNANRFAHIALTPFRACNTMQLNLRSFGKYYSYLEERGLTPENVDYINRFNAIDAAVKDAEKYSLSRIPEEGSLGEYILKMFQKYPIIFKVFGTYYPRFALDKLNYLYEHSPLAGLEFISKENRRLLSSDNPLERKKGGMIMAGIATGTLLIYLGIEKAKRKKAGEKYNEIHITDITVNGKEREVVIDLRRFAPIDSYALLGEIFVNGFKDIDKGAALWQLTTGTRGALSGDGWLLLDALRNKDDNSKGKILNRFAGNFLKGYLTPFQQVKDIAGVISPKGPESIERTGEVYPLGGAIERMPFISRQLPPKFLLTEPGIRKQESPLISLLNFFGAGTQLKDPVKKELDRLNINLYSIAMPKTGDAKTDWLVQSELDKLVGNFDRIIKSKEYKRLPDKEKKTMFIEMYADMKRDATETIKQYGELPKTMKKQKKEIESLPEGFRKKFIESESVKREIQSQKAKEKAMRRYIDGIQP